MPIQRGQPALPLYGDADPGDGFAWGLGPTTHMRDWFLDLGEGRSLLVDFEAPDAPTFDGLIDEATAIVESMVFTPPQ